MFSYTLFNNANNAKFLEILSLTNMPTPPEPLFALFETCVRLFPNHLYPEMSVISLSPRNASHRQMRSSLVASITLCLCLL